MVDLQPKIAGAGTGVGMMLWGRNGVKCVRQKFRV